MPADNVVIERCYCNVVINVVIYQICHHVFSEVITLQHQDKFRFIIRNLSFNLCRK